MKKMQITKKSGNALITALLFTFVAAAVVSAYVAYSANDARMTQRMLDYQKAKIAAASWHHFCPLPIREVGEGKAAAVVFRSKAQFRRNPADSQRFFAA